MSHLSQQLYVQRCADLIRDLLGSSDIKIVEIGSYDINGTVRNYFPDCSRYVGIDLISGPGVDILASGHEFGISNDFDLAISCECFEHNPYWLETFLNMIRVVRPGGVVLFTCATLGRPEHGTLRTDESSNIGGIATGWHYYLNLTSKDFYRRINLESHFDFYSFFTVKWSHDLFFFGIKKDWRPLNNGEAQFEKIQQRLSEVVSVIELSFPKRFRNYPILGRLNAVILSFASSLLSDRGFQNFRLRYIHLTKLLEWFIYSKR
jgi:SAM-dependent methyltransferase